MIKAAALGVLSAPPLWRALRNRALRETPLTVLCYHTLGPDTGGVDGWTVVPQAEFRAQLAYLKTHYDIVSLDEALGVRTAPKRPQLVITFDDGDKGLSTYLRPILLETPVPVTVYVATRQFEDARPFWFDRVVNALQGSHEIDVTGLGKWKLPIENGKARWMVLGEILQALKLVDPKEREVLADQVVAQGTSAPLPSLGPMGLDALKELADTPGVTIGAHSHGHELLDQIPLQQAQDSIARSGTLLREWSGQQVRHFAFPNGNHTKRLRDSVRDLGFASAAILDERLAPLDADPFALPRISIGRYDSQRRVRLRLVGL